MVQGGSDTEELDSEQPLTEAEQIVAILNTKAKCPPPLPVDPKHAVSTAAAVRNHILAIPYDKRTIAHDHALRMPATAKTIEAWLEQQFAYRRTERTIRLAMYLALNPNRSVAWVTKKAHGTAQSAGTAKGMALHLRCHAFTRFDVQRGCSLLQEHSEHRQARERERERLLVRQRSSESLDVAVVLIGFHSTARHFGAHRYRCVM